MVPLRSYRRSSRYVDHGFGIGGDKRIRAAITDYIVRRHIRDGAIILRAGGIRWSANSKRKERLQLGSEHHLDIPGQHRSRTPSGRWCELRPWLARRARRAPKTLTSRNGGYIGKVGWPLLYPTVKLTVPVTESHPLLASLHHTMQNGR